MLNMFLSLLKTVWAVVKYPLFIGLFLYVFLDVVVFVHVLYLRLFKGMEPKGKPHKKPKRPGIFHSLFLDLPRQIATAII